MALTVEKLVSGEWHRVHNLSVVAKRGKNNYATLKISSSRTQQSFEYWEKKERLIIIIIIIVKNLFKVGREKSV